MLHIMIDYLFKSLFASGDRRQSDSASIEAYASTRPSPSGTPTCRGFALATVVAEPRRRHHLSPRSRWSWIQLERHLPSDVVELLFLAIVLHICRRLPRTRRQWNAPRPSTACCVLSEWTAPGEYWPATSSIKADVWSERNGKSVLYHSLAHPDCRCYGCIQMPHTAPCFAHENATDEMNENNVMTAQHWKEAVSCNVTSLLLPSISLAN